MRRPNTGIGLETSLMLVSWQLGHRMERWGTERCIIRSRRRRILHIHQGWWLWCREVRCKLRVYYFRVFAARIPAYFLNQRLFTELQKKTCRWKTTRSHWVKESWFNKVLIWRWLPTVYSFERLAWPLRWPKNNWACQSKLLICERFYLGTKIS